MNNSGLLGRVFLAFGICLVSLSIGAFVNRAEASCDYCSDLVQCNMQSPPTCGSFNCSGGIGCALGGPCVCKTPIFNQNVCHCG